MSYRKLHIGKDIWEYVIGTQGVKIRNPKGEVNWVPIYTCLGLTKEEYKEKGLYEDEYGDRGFYSVAVGPGDVKKYIENKKD